MLRWTGLLIFVLSFACGGGQGLPALADGSQEAAEAPQGGDRATESETQPDTSTEANTETGLDVPAESYPDVSPEAYPDLPPSDQRDTAPTEVPQPTDRPLGEALVDTPASDRPFPGDCAVAFSGPGVGPDRPRIVYPIYGSQHPRNFANMNLQFEAAGQSLFRLRIEGDSVHRAVCFIPTTCDGDNCQWMIPQAEWTAALSDASGSSFDLILDGTSVPGGAVVTSEAVNLTASDSDFVGKIYYESTSLPGIVRATDVNGKAMPFVVPTKQGGVKSPSNPKDCAGCHDVTLDGTRITATYGHGDDYLGIASTADPGSFSAPVATTHSNWKTFSPDGTRLLDNFNGALVLRDGVSGAKLADVATAARAVMPSFSFKGDRVVYVELVTGSSLFYEVAAGFPKRDGGDWLITDGGKLVTLTFAGDAFSNPKTILDVAGSDYHYYPAFSPDDQWIVFNSGSKPGFSPVAQDTMMLGSYGVPAELLVSYDQRTSRLRMTRSDGSGVPTELVHATVAVGNTASAPRIAPFTTGGGSVFWITFSSKEDYGFVVSGGKLPQLWMAAVDLSRVAGGGDPSFSPLWLTVQDSNQANHFGVWRP